MSLAKSGLPLSIFLGVVLAGCGSESELPAAAAVNAKAAEAILPSDPLERAATCSGAFMAAAQLRPGFDQDGISEGELDRVLHPAYIDAGASGQIDPARLELTGNRSPVLAAEFRKNGRAEPTMAECEKAYPALQSGSFKALPADPAGARAACMATAAALAQSYRATAKVRSERLPAFERLIEQLTEPVFNDFQEKGSEDVEVMNKSLREVLAETMRSGPPGEVMSACLKRFS